MKIKKNRKKLNLAFGFLAVLSIGALAPIIISCSKSANKLSNNTVTSNLLTKDINLISYLDDDSVRENFSEINNINIKDGYELDLQIGDNNKEKYKFITHNLEDAPLSVNGSLLSYSYPLSISNIEIDIDKLKDVNYEKTISITYFSKVDVKATSNEEFLSSLEKSEIKKKVITEKNLFYGSDKYSLISDRYSDSKDGYDFSLNSSGSFIFDNYIEDSKDIENGVFFGLKSISIEFKYLVQDETNVVLQDKKSLNDFYLSNHVQNRYVDKKDLNSSIFNSNFSSFEEWRQKIDSFISLPDIDLHDPGIGKVLDGINLVNKSNLWLSRDNVTVGNPDDKDTGKAVANFLSNIKGNTTNIVKEAILKLVEKDQIKLGNSYFGKKELYLYGSEDDSNIENKELSPISKTLMIGGNKGVDVNGKDISSIKGDYSYDFVIPLDKDVKEDSRYLFTTSGISATIMHQVEGRKYDGGGTTNISYPTLKFNFLNEAGEIISTKKVVDERFRTDYTNESFNVLTYSGSNVDIIVPKGTKEVIATVEINVNLEKSGEAPRWDDYLNTFLKVISNVITNITSYGSTGAFKFLFDGSLASGAPNIFASLFNSIEAMINNPFSFGISLAGYEDNSVQDLVTLICPQVKPYVSTVFDVGWDGKPKWNPNNSAVSNYQWQSIQNKAISNVLGLLGSSIFNAIFGADLTELNFNKRADINNVMITSTDPKAFLVNLDAQKQIEDKLDFSNEIEKENFKKISKYVKSANNKLLDQKDKYNEYITKMQNYYEGTISNLFEQISNTDMSFVEKNINSPSLRLAKELESNIIQSARNSKDYNYMLHLKNIADEYINVNGKTGDLNKVVPNIINDTYMRKIEEKGLKLDYLATYNYSGSFEKIEIQIEEELEIQNHYKKIYELKSKLDQDKINNSLTQQEVSQIRIDIAKLENEVQKMVDYFNDSYQKYSYYLTKEIYWVDLLKQFSKTQAEWFLNNAFYSLDSQGNRITIPMNYRYIDNEDNFNIINGIDISYETLKKSNLSQSDIESMMNLDIQFFKILIKNNDFKSLTEIDMSNLGISGNFNSSRKDILDEPYLIGESSSLRYIDLSGNKISDFDFKGYKNLRAIDLSRNNLSGDITNLLENLYTNVDSANGTFTLNIYKNFLIYPDNSSQTANQLLQDIHFALFKKPDGMKWMLSSNSLTWQISVLKEINSYSFSENGEVQEKTILSNSYITYFNPLSFNSSAENITAKIEYEIVNDELQVKSISVPKISIDSNLNEVPINEDIKQFFIKEIKEAISAPKLVSVSGIFQFMNISRVSKAVLEELGIEYIDSSNLDFESRTISYSDEDNIGSFRLESSLPNVIEFTDLKVVQGDPYYILANNSFLENEIKKINLFNNLNMATLKYDSNKDQSIWLNNNFIFVLNKELFDNLSEKDKSNNKEIYIPQGISIIGKNFLSNSKVKKLFLNNDLIKIESNAFSSNDISELSIPQSLNYISNNSFASNNIKELKLGKGIKNIGKYAFRYNKISTIEFNDNLSLIDNYAFSDNLLNGEITLPFNIRYVGDFAFSNNSIKQLNIYFNQNLWNTSLDKLWEQNMNLYNLIHRYDDKVVVTSLSNQADSEGNIIIPKVVVI